MSKLVEIRKTQNDTTIQTQTECLLFTYRQLDLPSSTHNPRISIKFVTGGVCAPVAADRGRTQPETTPVLISCTQRCEPASPKVAQSQVSFALSVEGQDHDYITDKQKRISSNVTGYPGVWVLYRHIYFFEESGP